MGKFFPKATAIYLDQFAVSALCDDYENKTEPWVTINKLLKKGVSKGRIVCPYSVEHLIETSMKNERSAVSQDINFANLAQNVKLRNEVDSTCRYIMSLIRSKRPTYHTYFQSFSKTALDVEWKRMKLQEQRNLLEEMTSEIFGMANVIRGASKHRLTPSMRSFSFRLIQTQYEADLMERFFFMSTFGVFKTKTVTLSGTTMPYWADMLFHKLVTEYQMTREDALKGKQIIAEHGLIKFPSIFIRANLEASMACNNKKETINDQIDVIRIAGALPAVDIMLTDGGKANDIRDAKLDKQFRTEVYSSKTADLINFTTRLQTLV
jgi:hypothetical protein